MKQKITRHNLNLSFISIATRIEKENTLHKSHFPKNINLQYIKI